MLFEELLKRITPKLKGIIYKLNWPSTLFNVEDLSQEALMHLWGQFQEGKLKDKTDSYILQGCYFYLKNYLRTAKVKNREMSLEEILGDEDSSAAKSMLLKDGTTEEYLEHLNSRMLAETIRNNGLTNREKDILFLYAEGLTTREIGQRIHLSHVRVVRLMAQIRKKCNKYLDRS